MKRLSDPSTTETLKKFLAALKESMKRIARRRLGWLGCTPPPPLPPTDAENPDALGNIAEKIQSVNNPTTPAPGRHCWYWCERGAGRKSFRDSPNPMGDDSGPVSEGR